MYVLLGRIRCAHAPRLAWAMRSCLRSDLTPSPPNCLAFPPLRGTSGTHSAWVTMCCVNQPASLWLRCANSPFAMGNAHLSSLRPHSVFAYQPGIPTALRGASSTHSAWVTMCVRCGDGELDSLIACKCRCGFHALNGREHRIRAYPFRVPPVSHRRRHPISGMGAHKTHSDRCLHASSKKRENARERQVLHLICAQVPYRAWN